MNWKDILKRHCSGEKMSCGCAECSERTKKAVKTDKQIEKEILAEIEKEGGALGMKNLKSIADRKNLIRVLNALVRRGTVNHHKHGDLYTHEPKKGSKRRGPFTA